MERQRIEGRMEKEMKKRVAEGRGGEGVKGGVGKQNILLLQNAVTWREETKSRTSRFK